MREREKNQTVVQHVVLQREGLIKRFLTANQPATFAVGKSLYDAIPPGPIRHQENPDTSDDLFSDDLFGSLDDTATEIDDHVIDESGRKLLSVFR